MKKFEVGQRVVLRDSALKEYNDDGDYPQEGIVQEIHKSGKCLVKWDKGWQEGKTAEVEPDDLASEEEAEKILITLEDEYEAWASPIRNKMQQVAQLLQEAAELATEQNKNLTDMHTLVSPLLVVMEDLGWSTSSLSC